MRCTTFLRISNIPIQGADLQNAESNKHIAKNTVYLYLRMIVSMLISFYTSRAFLDALGVEDYGIYNIVGGFVSLLSLITGSLTMGAQRFITFALGKNDEAHLRRTFSTFSNLFLIVAAALVLIGAAFGPYVIYELLNLPPTRLGAALFCYFCSLIAFAVNIIAIPYTASVISHEKMGFYAVASISESVLKLLIVFALYATTFDRLKVYASLLVVVGIIVRIAYGIYCSKRFPETKPSRVIDRKILKEAFFFTFWMAFGNAAVIAKEQGVNVVLNLFCGVSINAARGISMQISSAMNQFGSSIALAINPQITKSYAAGDRDRSVRLTFLLTKAQGLMLVLIALPLYFEVDFLLGFWLKEVPCYANIFTRWVILLSVAAALRNTYSALYLATGDVKTLQWTIGLIYLMNLPFSYAALKMGYEPVVTMQIAFAIEIITWIGSYWYMQWKFRFPTGKYMVEAILPLVVIVTITAALLWGLQELMPDRGVGRFLLTVAADAVSVTGLAYWLLLNKNERKFVVRAIRSKIHGKQALCG